MVTLLRELNEQKIVALKQTGEQVGKLKRKPAKERADCIYLPLAPITVKEAGEELTPYLDSETGMLTDFAFAREQSFAMVSDKADWYFWLDDDDEIVGAQHLRDLAYRAAPEIDGFVFKYDYARDERG